LPAIAGFAVLTLLLIGAGSLIRAQIRAQIGEQIRAVGDKASANGQAPSAASPASAKQSASATQSSSATEATEGLAALGKRIFHDTPNEATPYVGARLACASCHLNDGTTPYAAPMTGIAPLFPEFSQRAKRMISLKERIDECFIRSENGRPLPEGGKEMAAMVAYIESLSGPNNGGAEPSGRGLVNLPALSGNPQRGEAIYAAQCAACHGSEGNGIGSTFPPIWGPESFNDGAGMYGLVNMAAFVIKNMPPASPGSLTPQQAFDISAYVHSKPRPKYDHAFDKY
jgi:thiosulfate dehydrogenase